VVQLTPDRWIIRRAKTFVALDMDVPRCLVRSAFVLITLVPNRAWRCSASLRDQLLISTRDIFDLFGLREAGLRKNITN